MKRAPDPKPNRRAFVGFGDPEFAVAAESAPRRGAVRNLNVEKGSDSTEARVSAAAKGVSVPGNPAPPSFGRAFSKFGALPDTAAELREIAGVLRADVNRDLYLGRRATEANVRSAVLDDRRVVAFATHGLAPGDIVGLDQPALVLSDPKLSGEAGVDDGLLTMDEVLGLKQDADWVVLSACNTASADGAGTEAMSGLARENTMARFPAEAPTITSANSSPFTSPALLTDAPKNPPAAVP